MILLLLSNASQWLRPNYSEENAVLKLKLQQSDIIIKANKIKIHKNDSIYETIQKNINIDSVFIWDADRKYRDSIRASVNPS